MTNEERKELERRIAVETHKLNGGRIEIKSVGYDWREYDDWSFNWGTYDYRIAEPVKKKIKLEAWLDNETGSLGHYVEGCSGITVPRFTRLPDLDIETEVME